VATLGVPGASRAPSTAVSVLRDDLRTRSEAFDLPQGVWGGNGRERREEGADDHPLNATDKLASLCGNNAGTVSPRRSRITGSSVRA
jgi:hypothetical protein